MDRTFAGKPAPAYLWDDNNVVPFLKVDRGLAEESAGVQLMKPLDNLDSLLARGLERDVFGTKMRSVIHRADPAGIAAILDQQFELAARISDAGLTPIMEPEVDIHSPDKAAAEDLLHGGIVERLDALAAGKAVLFKVTLPSAAGLYDDLVTHPAVLRLLALSGGYSRDEACDLLIHNHQLTASFSRALTEGLDVKQSDEEFDAVLDASIGEIYAASVNKRAPTDFSTTRL
jgi:fructose-bisphosphate aldolase class I